MKNIGINLSWITNSLRGLATGLVSGIFITIFANAIYYVGKVNSLHWWLFLLLPIGAVATSLLYRKLGKDYKKATVFAIDEIHIQEERKERNLATSQNVGQVNPMMGIIGFLSASISHLLGASVGKEGVGVQIGISVAALLNKGDEKISRIFNNIDNESRAYYMMSGASAAFGSLFGSPISGLLFGLQFASPDILRLDALLPCTIASFSATLVTKSLHAHIMQIPQFIPLAFTIKNLAIVIVFAIICGLFERMFCFAIEKCKSTVGKECCLKSSMLVAIVPSVAAVAIILANLIIAGNLDYNGLSTGLLYRSISADVPLYAFLMKAILILLCTLSGFVGGEVVPLLVLGSTFGFTFATIFSLEIPPFAVLGAIAMLTGGTNLPLVCFMLGMELFGYTEPMLLFIACAISYSFSGKSGIYDHQRNTIK